MRSYGRWRIGERPPEGGSECLPGAAAPSKTGAPESMIDDQVVVAGIDVHARDPRGELDAEILLRLVHHEQLRRSLASGNLIDEGDQQLLEMSRVLFEVPCDVCPVPLADD